jgi:hypothetical protein
MAAMAKCSIFPWTCRKGREHKWYICGIVEGICFCFLGRFPSRGQLLALIFCFVWIWIPFLLFT